MKIYNKRTAYKVSTYDWTYSEVCVIEDENGKPLYAHHVNDPDDIFSVGKQYGATLYDTEEEAKAAVESLIPSDEEIMKVLRYFRNGGCEGERFDSVHKMIADEWNEDYAERVMTYSRCKPDCYTIPTEFEYRVADYMKHGVINMDARSFRREDVAMVVWGEDSSNGGSDPTEAYGAELVLRDNLGNVRAQNWVDRWFIYYLFGENNTGREFPGIHGVKGDD